MRIKVSKQSENVFNNTEDRKPPKLTVQVKATSEKGQYEILIVHPNRDAEFKYITLYSKVHSAKNFEEALAIAREIERTQFWDVVTKFEEIKHIPNYKKGFVKLKTKEAHEEEQAEQATADKKQKKDAKEVKKHIKKIIGKEKKAPVKSKINNKINKKQKKLKK